MADETKIAWTDHTFNPWMGCLKVSDGCKNCYAETLTTNRMGLHLWGKNAKRQVTAAGNWRKPAGWNKQATKEGRRHLTFCGSLCDVFEKRADLVEPRERLFDLIAATPMLEWQLLTKRPENIADMLPESWGDGWPNVWLGASIENEKWAHRADSLREVPAAVRFISYEPALGPLDTLVLDGINWIIYGGESGPGFRPHDIQWARDMRDRCEANDTAFYYKQSPGRRPGMLIALDGEVVRNYPKYWELRKNRPEPAEKALF